MSKELSTKQRAARIMGHLVGVSGLHMDCGPWKLGAWFRLADFLGYGDMEKALTEDDEAEKLLEVCGDLEALLEMSESWLCEDEESSS